MVKKRKIKDNHILVVGAGHSIKKYKNEIYRFIEENNPVTFACNYINNIIIPDYHLWNSVKRWNLFADSIDKKSILVFSSTYPKDSIREKIDGSYKTFKVVERRWKTGWENENSRQYKRCKVCYRKGKMFGCFRDSVTLAIFYAYIKGASKISVVGADGYTFYPDKNNINAHCFEEGLETEIKIRQIGQKYYKDLDIENNRTLLLLYKYVLKKYGFGFEMLTPTIHTQFYNKNILNIKK